jgi:hypothetical protein
MSPHRMRRRPFLASLTFGLVALLVEGRARAGDELVLVLHAKNGESPDLATVKRMFLGDTAFWPGNVPVHPFVRPAGTPAGDAFFRAIEVAPGRFKRLWQEKELSGKGTAPETVDAVSALAAKVAADRGAIGVALASELPAGTPGVRLVPLQ